jgi:hypothetical protein
VVVSLVSERIIRFQGRNMNLDQLSGQIYRQLESEGYKVQSTTAPVGIVIQAQKAGIMREIITADRAFTILITGQPNDFSVHVGIGKWGRDLAIMATETILLSWLFLAIDIPEMLWTRHVENGIIMEITQIVERTQSYAPAPQTNIYCVSCGTEIPKDAFYCPKCGQKQPTQTLL